MITILDNKLRYNHAPGHYDYDYNHGNLLTYDDDHQNLLTYDDDHQNWDSPNARRALVRCLSALVTLQNQCSRISRVRRIIEASTHAQAAIRGSQRRLHVPRQPLGV